MRTRDRDKPAEPPEPPAAVEPDVPPMTGHLRAQAPELDPQAAAAWVVLDQTAAHPGLRMSRDEHRAVAAALRIVAEHLGGTPDELRARAIEAAATASSTS